MVTETCPLCTAVSPQFYFEDEKRPYRQCAVCQLVFVPPEYHLTPEAEKAQYDFHQNDPADQRYRQFLSRLATPLQQYIQPQSTGLDFGAGPGPTLSVMLNELGYDVAIYDPFYANDQTMFEQSYDFVTATEVFEHLHHPRQELDRLMRVLQPNGVLGVMTKLVYGRSAFANWHYKNDPTHVSFFSTETLQWVAEHWQLEIIFAEKDVTIFRRGRS